MAAERRTDVVVEAHGTGERTAQLETGPAKKTETVEGGGTGDRWVDCMLLGDAVRYMKRRLAVVIHIVGLGEADAEDAEGAAGVAKSADSGHYSNIRWETP